VSWVSPNAGTGAFAAGSGFVDGVDLPAAEETLEFVLASVAELQAGSGDEVVTVRVTRTSRPAASAATRAARRLRRGGTGRYGSRRPVNCSVRMRTN
jgi:hypothetical protein